jgi:hypothetical protein
VFREGAPAYDHAFNPSRGRSPPVNGTAPNPAPGAAEVAPPASSETLSRQSRCGNSAPELAESKLTILILFWDCCALRLAYPFLASSQTADGMPRSIHSPEYQRLRALLVEARTAAGLTQHQLSELIDRPQSYVAKYEIGERRLDVVELVEICRALRVDPCDLLRKLNL